MGLDCGTVGSSSHAFAEPTEEEMAALQEYRAAFIKRVDDLRAFVVDSQQRGRYIGHEALVPFTDMLTQTQQGLGKRDTRELFWPAQELDENPSLCSNIHLCDLYSEAATSPKVEIRGFSSNFAVVTDHPGELEQRIYVPAEKYDSADCLGTIQARCFSARLKPCNSRRCQSRRALLEQFLPTCSEWPQFRRWVLGAASCQMAASATGIRWLNIFQPTSLLQYFERMMSLYGDVIKYPGDSALNSITMFKVRQLLYFWHRQAQGWTRIVPKVSAQDPESGIKEELALVLRRCSMRTIGWATGTATRLRVCPYRLWNVAKTAEWAENALPALMDLAGNSAHPEPFAHLGHDGCSAQSCQFADENSTLKQQLHKCAGASCGNRVKFKIERLDDIVRANLSMAWPLDGLMEGGYSHHSSPPAEYMAISHVWSDGTGVGIREPGDVNECLVAYFKKVAEQLGCDGIWWDTVCIPLEREARRVAMSQMHLNYENAKCTIVHDEYLLQFPWAEDGSPALALVLSPWFTRGWTALELSVSKSVKVIYRDPHNPEEQVIKDLYDDVLARDFASLGHRFASGIVQRLNGTPTSFTELIKILSTRTTSWARDRNAIAALLARAEGFDYGDSEADVMRKMLRTFPKIPEAFVHHGSVPLCGKGGLSWCPGGVFTGGHAGDWARIGDDALMAIDAEGAACGTWHCIVVDDYVRLCLDPHANHPSVESRIYQALEKSDRCLCLFHKSPGMRIETAVLVETAGLGQADGDLCIDCHYVGCVKDNTDMKGWAFCAQSVHEVMVKIGCGSAKPALPAKSVVREYLQTRDGNELTNAQFSFYV